MSTETLDQLPIAEVFRALVSAADDAELGVTVTLLEDAPRTIFVNDAAARMYGRDREELLRTPVWELIPDDEMPHLMDLYRRRMRGDDVPAKFETAVLTPAGERVPIEIATCRVETAGGPANVTFSFDIRTRKRAAEALADSEARFRSVVELAPDGVAILRGPTIIYLNPRGLEMLGYSSVEEVAGRSIVDHMIGEDKRKAGDRLGVLLRTGNPVEASSEYRTRRTDGSERIVEISAMRIDYERAPAILGFARDVTERKALEVKLLMADRLAAVGTLAAGVAHEINNPLAFMTLGLTQLERELGTLEGSDRVGRMLETVRRVRQGADRVATIVRDLKAFARPGDDRPAPVSIAQVIGSAARMTRAEYRHKARLVTDLAELAPVWANAARLEQVFVNLIVNAAQAIGEGDIERDEIRIVARSDGDGHLVVEVSDTGCGIPEETQPLVFEPFYTTKPMGIGTGLGLAICRSIIQSGGGQIWLSSQLGAGTTLSMRLPVAPEDKRNGGAEPTSVRTPPPASRGRLLIVDDEALVASSLREMLRDEWDVTIATSGAEALAAVANDDFAAMLCDLMMPSMSGIELFGRLQSEHPWLARKVVFMSGATHVPRNSEFLEGIDNPCLDKPFDFEQLRAALAQAAGERESTK